MVSNANVSKVISSFLSEYYCSLFSLQPNQRLSRCCCYVEVLVPTTTTIAVFSILLRLRFTEATTSSLAVPHHSFHNANPTTKTLPRLRLPILLSPAAARRVPSFPQEGGSNGDLVEDARNWGHVINSMYVEGGGVEDVDSDDEEEEDRSLDLLIRFMQNVFKKVSKRARKAVRSVLPSSISTKLVGFSVNGVLILTFLWVLKAFLEVVCTLGSVVFVSILLIRGVWSGVAYFQESQSHPGGSEMNHDGRAWTGVRPAT